MTEKGIKKVTEGKQEEGCRRRDGSVHDRGIAISELFPTTVHTVLKRHTDTTANIVHTRYDRELSGHFC
jgi:hypothetical protein